jgi:hypothetical protein
MSQQIGGYPPSTATGSPAGQPTTQVARDEAADVGRTAADAGRQVAGTAAEQATNVAQEVKTQARDLLGEARGQVQDQARTGQQKAAEGIRALSQELREMSDGAPQGTVSEVARQAADRADHLAEWLGRREPGDLLDEVRSFARRRPGAFLLGAAIAGVVVGRLTRGAVDAARDSGPVPQRVSEPQYPGAGYAAHPAPGYTASGYTGPGYTAHTTPGYAAPGYTEPAHAAPGYAAPVGAPYGAPPPGRSDTPTPPQGFPAPTPYPSASTTSASPVPPAPAEPARDLDPVDPLDRPAPRTVGEYVDEVERAGEHTYADDRRDAPYRPGDGGLR